MKNLIGILAISFMACSAYSQDSSAKTSDNMTTMSKMKKDFFFMKDGKMMATKKGESMAMTNNVHLTNGSSIKIDGTIEMPDGSTKMLKEGQYIDIDGKIGMTKNKPK